MHSGDCGCNCRIEQPVIGRFCRQPAHGGEPLVDGGWSKFLLDQHRLVLLDQSLAEFWRRLVWRPCQEFVDRGRIRPQSTLAGKSVESKAHKPLAELNWKHLNDGRHIERGNYLMCPNIAITFRIVDGLTVRKVSLTCISISDKLACLAQVCTIILELGLSSECQRNPNGCFDFPRSVWSWNTLMCP